MKQLLFILILLCSFQGFGQIKGYWRLDGNSNDASGNGNNGINTNISFVNAGLNGSAYFNNTANISTNLNISGYSKITVSCWIYVISMPSGNDPEDFDRAIGTRDNSTGTASFPSIFIDIYKNGSIRFGIKFSNVNDASDSLYGLTISGLITSGKWYSVVMTYDGTNLVGYLNANKVFTPSSKSGVIQTSSYGVNMGCRIAYNGAKTSYVNGYIDNCAINNKEMSHAQIKNEYSRVKGFYQN